MKESTRDERRVLDGIRNLVRLLRLSEREAERRHGITAAQLFVLHEIGGSDGISLGELAARTATDQSSVSEVVRKLEAAALVSRSWSRDDRRRAELSVTRAGSRLLKSSGPSAPERLVLAIRDLTPLRRRQLAGALDLVLDAMGKRLEAPPMFFEDRAKRRSAKR